MISYSGLRSSCPRWSIVIIIPAKGELWRRPFSKPKHFPLAKRRSIRPQPSEKLAIGGLRNPPRSESTKPRKSTPRLLKATLSVSISNWTATSIQAFRLKCTSQTESPKRLLAPSPRPLIIQNYQPTRYFLQIFLPIQFQTL